LALDLILVGIDTVSLVTLPLGYSVSYYSWKLRASQCVFITRITSVAT
jgi:hypothetical protein